MAEDQFPTPPPLRGRAWSLAQLSSPATLVVSAIVVMALFAVTRQIADPDFWWHLRAGQIILATHALIPTDPFTYTATGHAWTMHEWLTEVLFAWLYGIGGIGLIVVVLSFFTWAGILFIYQRVRLDQPHFLPLVIGLAMGIITGYPIWGPRAQMLTFTLTCLVLYLADRHLRRGGRLIWVLVPIFTVWSNLHSGFVLGLGFLGLIVVAEGLGARLGFPEGAPRQRVLQIVGVMGAGLLAALLNPNGPGIVLYPFGTVASAAQQALIQEWHSPDFHDFLVRIGFAPMMLSLVLLVIVNRRIRAREAALAVVTIALSLQSERNIALFVAACTAIWIGQADLALQRFLGWRSNAAAQRRLPPATLALRTAVFALVLGMIALLDTAKLVSVSAVKEDSLVYAQDMPVCAARWLLSAPPGLRIFNQYGEGGYLSYRLQAHGDKVYIFGDAALMGDPLLIRYGLIQDVQPEWEALLRQSQTSLVLFDVGEPITNVLEKSPRWVTVYKDNRSEAFALKSQLASLHLPPAPTPSTNPADTCFQLAHNLTSS